MFAVIGLTGVPFLDLCIILVGIGVILWAMKAGGSTSGDPK